MELFLKGKMEKNPHKKDRKTTISVLNKKGKRYFVITHLQKICFVITSSIHPNTSAKLWLTKVKIFETVDGQKENWAYLCKCIRKRIPISFNKLCK